MPARTYSVSAEMRSPSAMRLEDLGRRLAQTPLDLAEVRIGDAGELAQLAQRQARVATLVANEVAEVVQARLERVQRLGVHPAVPATCRVDDLAIERVDHAVQLRGGARRARARSRAARSIVSLELVESRVVGRLRERRVDDQLLAAVGPVQLDRRRLLGSTTRVADGRRAPGFRTEDAREVGDELVEAAAALRGASRSASRISMRACTSRR